ncbi:putative DD34D transposase [Trichonephila clavipes]|nr:putative DD34D transposase [Trichonephila clavipes]
METNKEKIWYILQFFFDKGENARQAAEIVNGVYGVDTVTQLITCSFGFVDSVQGQTLNSGIYCQQLDRLKLVTDQKRPALANRRGVVFHQDNVRPHMSVVIRQKLWKLGWKVLMHPPYIPDQAPNDYHLFFSHCKTSIVKRNWDQEKIGKIDY